MKSFKVILFSLLIFYTFAAETGVTVENVDGNSMGCCYTVGYGAAMVECCQELHDVHGGDAKTLVAKENCPVEDLMGGSVKFEEKQCTDLEWFTTTNKCCLGPVPALWDEGGVCCSDGGWHADVGDGSTRCADFNLEDSSQCPVSQEGENCEGLDENTGKPFPKCGEGLSCESTGMPSIPGAGNVCVRKVDICALCARSHPNPITGVDGPCLGKGACLLIETETNHPFNCEIDPVHFTSKSVCHDDAGHWCEDCPNATLGSTAKVDTDSPTEGCRAPSDFYKGVSCESCCDQNFADCIEHSGEQWYNERRFLPSSDCPSACPKCAACSTRDEENLQKLTPPAECNPSECATMNIGIDPCFSPFSCECFCETANRLLQSCPQVHPDWLDQTTEGPTVDDSATGIIACPADTFECPDGRFVSRDPANKCEFEECTASDQACDEDVFKCPDGTFVSRDPKNNCEFAECKASPQVCPEDTSECPDGSFVSRNPDNNCEFDECSTSPKVCPQDVFECPDGTFASRNPKNNCEFDECQPPQNDPVSETVYTLQGPWDLKKIRDESDSLVRAFTQTLGVFPTTLHVYREQGIVQIMFIATAKASLLEPLKSSSFRGALELNIKRVNPDLAVAMFIGETEVMAYFVLEGPWSISAVQEYDENLLAQFSFVLGMNPDQIEEEITTENKLVEVIYKVKGNPQQIAPLYDGAQFSQALKSQISNTNPRLAVVLGLGICPMTPPSESGAFCVGEMRCEYGQECCCGSCSPKLIAVCADGIWMTMFTETCMAPDCEDSSKAGVTTRQGMLRSPHPQVEAGDSSKPNYISLILIFTGAVIFGVVSYFITRQLCCVKKTSTNNLSDNLYHDISLDTQDLARSV